MEDGKTRNQIVELLSEAIALMDSIQLRIEAAHVSMALERLRGANLPPVARAGRTIST